MSGDIIIYLKKNAETNKLVKLLLISLGNKKYQSTYSDIHNIDFTKDSTKENRWSIDVEQYEDNLERIKITKNTYIERINIKDCLDTSHSTILYNELSDDKWLLSGTYDKMLSCDGTDIWYALGKKAIDFFGGMILKTDSDLIIYENKNPKYTEFNLNDDINQKQHDFINLLAKESVLTYQEMLEAQKKATYKSQEKDWVFLVKSNYEQLNKELQQLSNNEVKKSKNKI